MSLTSGQLDAFEIIAEMGSLSKAAKVLHLSQPALTRRLQSLENDLGLQLFLRVPNGVKLTESGSRLILYVRTKRKLEEELRYDLSSADRGKLGGRLKIAAYSAVMHPIVVFALSEFIRKEDNVQVEFVVTEVSYIPELLFKGDADFVITDFVINRSGIENTLIGHEEFVAIESTKYKTRQDVFLDVSPPDLTTEKFFQHQSIRTPKYSRSFMHDDPGILWGVSLGLGRGILPLHSIPKSAPVKVIKKYKALKNPVYLQYRKQVFIPRLYEEVIKHLSKNCKHLFKRARSF